MEAQALNRRLTVILHADVQGYSRLIEQDDDHFSLEVDRQRTPFKDPVVAERWRAALQKAGLK